MALALWLQWREPLLYPLPIAIGGGVFFLASVLLLWRRTSFVGFFERVAPPMMLLFAIALALLMAEESVQHLILSILAVLTVVVSLEMLFYFLFDPKRYPVNALSHMALAIVPLTAYAFAVGLSGLRVFVQLPGWIPCLIFGVYGIVAYWTTEHPVADRASRHRWRVLGAIIGLQVALFGLLLPLEVWTQGLLAALLFAIPLRIRRYAFPPTPSHRLALAETLFVVVFFVTLLLTARWA